MTVTWSRGKRYRAIEFALVFLVLPVALYVFGSTLKRWIIPMLLGVGGICLYVLRQDAGFDRTQLWSLPPRRNTCVKRILALFLTGGALVMIFTCMNPAVEPFGLPRRQPLLWALVVLFYPLVSALPQELIFRSFMFHRYRELFTPPRLVMVSATCFALVHFILGNGIAPVMSLLGGLLFAYTYSRTRSLPLVVLEHGLWGDWIFTLGLGRYFYGGHF